MNWLAIYQMFSTYGPFAITALENLEQRLEAGKTVTIVEVEAAFTALEPYDKFGIVLANSQKVTPPTP